MKKFKVVEVTCGLGAGGAEKSLVTRLKYRPSNFDICILNTRPEIDKLVLSSEFKSINMAKRSFNFFLEVGRVLGSYSPDFVVVRTPLDSLRFALIKLLSPRSSWKLVFEAHSNFVTSKKYFGFIMLILLRIARRRIYRTLAVSENVMNGPLGQGGSKCTILYLGADMDIEAKLFQPLADTSLVFVGRLVPIKQPLLLLRAIDVLNKEIPLPDGFLTIVGDGPLRKEMENFIISQDLTGCVKIVGFVEDVQSYLLESTHLISVSKNEGLPISFFEAKLAGLRIISTPSGGGSEIFDDFDYELPSFEIQDLVDHLKSILGTAITSESRHQIAKNSVWMQAKECSKKYYELLESLAD